MASQNHTKAPQQEETALSNLLDDCSDGTVLDSDSDLGDLANVALPNDAETPLEETSEKDPDMGANPDSPEVAVPEGRRRQKMQKRWDDFDHPALGGKKVIEDPSDRSMTFLMMCRYCSKEHVLSTWKKMRPWDPKHFIDHVNLHCRKYQ